MAVGRRGQFRKSCPRYPHSLHWPAFCLIVHVRTSWPSWPQLLQVLLPELLTGASWSFLLGCYFRVTEGAKAERYCSAIRPGAYSWTRAWRRWARSSARVRPQAQRRWREPSVHRSEGVQRADPSAFRGSGYRLNADPRRCCVARCATRAVAFPRTC